MTISRRDFLRGVLALAGSAVLDRGVLRPEPKVAQPELTACVFDMQQNTWRDRGWFVGAARVYNRYLTDEEIREIGPDPWGLYRPLREDSWHLAGHAFSSERRVHLYTPYEQVSIGLETNFARPKIVDVFWVPEGHTRAIPVDSFRLDPGYQIHAGISRPAGRGYIWAKFRDEKGGSASVRRAGD